MNAATYTALALLLLGRLGAETVPAYSVTVHTLQNGAQELTLVNHGTSMISAFHAAPAASCAVRMEVVHGDLLQNGPTIGVNPGASYTFTVPKLPEGCNVGVDAVLFVDGTSAGNEQAVAALYAQRHGVKEELTVVRPMVLRAAAGQSDETALRNYLVDRFNAVRDDSVKSLAEKRGHTTVLHALQRRMGFAASANEGQVAAPTAEVPDFETRARGALGYIDSWQNKLSTSSTPDK